MARAPDPRPEEVAPGRGWEPGGEPASRVRRRRARRELHACVATAVHAVAETPFGPVVRALLSQVAVNPAIGDPFRASAVRARREEVARVMARGIARGDLREDADVEVATELLVGPVYFRLVFGGALDEDFATRIANSFYAGVARHPAAEPGN